MPNARVVNAEPDSLRRICFFEPGQEALKKLVIDKNNLNGKLGKLNEEFDRVTQDKVKEFGIGIKGNNKDDYERVQFYDGKKHRINHIDGILQDLDTGEILHFLALQKDVNIQELEEGSIVEYFEEKDNPDSKFRGVYEVILHKRKYNGKLREIEGDILVNGKERVVVGFVMVKNIAKKITPDMISYTQRKEMLTKELRASQDVKGKNASS